MSFLFAGGLPLTARGYARRRTLLLCGILATAIVLTACGGEEDEDFGDGGPAPGSTAETIQGRGILASAGTLVYGTAPAPGQLPLDRSIFAGGRIFNDSSPFNTPVPSTTPLHPGSDALVTALVERAHEGFVVATTEWTSPAFRADASTPRYDVQLTVSWTPFGILRDVPIPDVAIADPQVDGDITVIDFENGWVYDLWQARRTADGWAASWGNRIALDSDGIFPRGMSARGSGFSSLMGLIWPHEIAAGRIEHALAFSTDPNRAQLFVAPATESDGTSNDPLTLPEGSRLRLDPRLDLETLNLRPWERTIARAMQEYGIFLVDNGSASITLYAVHPASFGGFETPWPLEDGITFLEGIPMDRLQLLPWGEARDTETFPIEVTDSSIYAEPREVD